MRKNVLVLLHVLAWLCFLPSPFLLQQADIVPIPLLLVNLLLPVIFYINYFFAVPFLYTRKKIEAYLFFIIAAKGIFMAASYMADHNILLFSFVRVSVVIITSCLLALHSEQQKKREGQLGSELFALKAQINPHFLFNTLNNIYALTLEQSEKAPDAVVKLASLMRYATDTRNEQIPLSQEMVQVNNYITLHRIRLTDNVILKTSIPSVPTDLYIAPFILIPFLECLFNEGVNSQEKSKLFIYFVVENDTLILKTEINKVFIQSEVKENASISMAHALQRLELLYGERYSLDKSEDEHVSALLLKIKLR